jgi:hypothetical protein
VLKVAVAFAQPAITFINGLTTTQKSPVLKLSPMKLRPRRASL